MPREGSFFFTLPVMHSGARSAKPKREPGLRRAHPQLLGVLYIECPKHAGEPCEYVLSFGGDTPRCRAGTSIASARSSVGAGTGRSSLSCRIRRGLRATRTDPWRGEGAQAPRYASLRLRPTRVHSVRET